MKPIWFWLIVLAGVAIAFAAGTYPAFPHGTLSWASDYHNPAGIPCCTGPSDHGEGDCAEVPDSAVISLRIGDTVRVPFPSGEQTVRITSFFASPDPHTPVVVCSPGCVFRGAGT